MIIFIRKKILYKWILFVFVFTIGLTKVFPYFSGRTKEAFAGKKYIAIIIDDFGNDSAGTKEMLSLDIPFTAAVMPGLPSSKTDAEAVFAVGNDVILHMPMEPKNGKLSMLGPNALLIGMDSEKIIENVLSSLAEINYAIGMNNHTGSKAMEDKNIVENIMKVMHDKNLMFIDSKTTQSTAAKQVAKELSVPYLERDVFLDGTQDIYKIEQNLLSCAEIADEKGYAICIGHVGPAGGVATYKAIKNVAPKLIEQGYQFVTISELYEMLSL